MVSYMTWNTVANGKYSHPAEEVIVATGERELHIKETYILKISNYSVLSVLKTY